jgi:hypothetical protein
MESKLATFRLFVQHGRPLESSKEERELRQQFEKFGRVTSFSTRRGEWRNSLVTFSNTEQAVKAKKELDKTRLTGMTLVIFFTKPTRRVLVRGLPNNVSLTDLKREFRGAVHVENDGEHDTAITFDTISDAQAAVSDTRSYRGRELSFDFGNEERGRRRHSSPPRRKRSGPGRSREVIRRRSPSPRTEYKRRSRMPPVRSVRKRSRSRSGSKSRSKSAPRRTSAKKLALSSSSSSSSSSLSRERKRSKSKKESVEKMPEQRKEDEKKEIVEKKDELRMEDEIPQVNEVEKGRPIVADAAEAVVAHREGEEEEDAEEDGPCGDCNRLLHDLKNHVDQGHADSHAVVLKAMVKAWFEAHYSREGLNGAGEIASAVTRTTLLAEVNSFLAHMGWPKWKTQSPLYKDWFLREVMALSDDDIRKGRNWSLFHKDGFAPGGNVENARNKEHRMAEMVAKLRQYMN